MGKVELLEAWVPYRPESGIVEKEPAPPPTPPPIIAVDSCWSLLTFKKLQMVSPHSVISKLWERSNIHYLHLQSVF